MTKRLSYGEVHIFTILVRGLWCLFPCFEIQLISFEHYQLEYSILWRWRFWPIYSRVLNLSAHWVNTMIIVQMIYCADISRTFENQKFDFNYLWCDLRWNIKDKIILKLVSWWAKGMVGLLGSLIFVKSPSLYSINSRLVEYLR